MPDGTFHDIIAVNTSSKYKKLINTVRKLFYFDRYKSVPFNYVI